MREYEIHHRGIGPLGEDDESWTLQLPANGVPAVRHTLSRMDVQRGRVTWREDTQTILVREYLTEHPSGIVRERLLGLLGDLGIDAKA